MDGITNKGLIELKTLSNRFALQTGRLKSALQKALFSGISNRVLNDGPLPRSSLGGYNRHRAVTAAASKRAATKRRNLRKRSPH